MSRRPLRVSAWPNVSAEHLGLLPAQPPLTKDSQVYPNMLPVPEPYEYDFGSEEDKMVADCLSDEFNKLWASTGITNRDIFEKIFRPLPNDHVTNWKEYESYIKPNEGIMVGSPSITM